MSTKEKYLSVLANITRSAPTNIDDVIGLKDERPVGYRQRKTALVPPSALLWKQERDSEVSHIGIRINKPLVDPAPLVGKLAAMALERSVVPIFISWIGNTGLQHYGLHVEQVAGDTKADCDAYEEHLKRMWDLAIIIDAEDVLQTLA